MRAASKFYRYESNIPACLERLAECMGSALHLLELYETIGVVCFTVILIEIARAMFHI